MAGGTPALPSKGFSSLEGCITSAGWFLTHSWFCFLAVNPLWLIHLTSGFLPGFLAFFVLFLGFAFLSPPLPASGGDEPPVRRVRVDVNAFVRPAVEEPIAGTCWLGRASPCQPAAGC